MTQTVSAARWCAVSKLQNIMNRFAPGSFESEVADYAIDLALSPDRKEDRFFLRNVWRDARSICIRRKRRTAERGGAPLSIYGNDCDDDGVYSVMELAGTVPSAETVLGWKEQRQRLRAVVDGANRYAGAVLDGWIEGDEMAETAEVLCISERYVKKLRATIRATAAELADCRSAA
ncbi:MAG: hypothetical protein HQL33_05520 [Alphaproteobacteria bacterium]|nr:hypothetical protein [Alphaproteobacteria bacterium]